MRRIIDEQGMKNNFLDVEKFNKMFLNPFHFMKSSTSEREFTKIAAHASLKFLLDMHFLARLPATYEQLCYKHEPCPPHHQKIP